MSAHLLVLPFPAARGPWNLLSVPVWRAAGRGGGGVGLILLSLPALAQSPKINTFFPIGGKAGTTVETEIRGANLDGTSQILCTGKGVSAGVEPGGGKADEKFKPVWQQHCGACHELRSPANRSMTPAQWTATVQRMIKQNNAPISPDDADKITQYLTSAARAGKITAKVTIAPDAQPGLYEMRAVTARGVSTAAPFEVGTLPEVTGVNGKPGTAQIVTLPCAANGSLSGSGERHYYRFAAKKGERLVFNLKAFRYNEAIQMFFNPDLRLLDSSGSEIAENHGYYELDPLIDWQCPADGEYTLQVSDLLGRGNPGSVYRLVMGTVPYDTVVVPPAGQSGARVAGFVEGKNTVGVKTAFDAQAPSETGITEIGTPFGTAPFYVSPYPVVHHGAGATATKLPAAFAGAIQAPGASDTFALLGGGAYEIEAFSARIGSPASPRVAVLDSAGNRAAGFDGENRTIVKLDQAKTYTLRVEEANGKGGSEYAYCVEIRPARPDLACVARPDNVTLRPGLSATVQVILTRRSGVDGDVTVTAEDLPPGVTAYPAVIQPDRGDAWLVLSAAPDAKPSAQPFRIVASAHGPAGDVKVRALPQELFRLNNDPRYVEREQSVIAVCGTPQFTVELASHEPISVHPRIGTPVKVLIHRNAGFTGYVAVRLLGLPSGWVANDEGAGGNQSEVTLTVRPDGNNPQPFIKRDAKLTPILALLEANSDDFRFTFGGSVVRPAPTAEAELKEER